MKAGAFCVLALMICSGVSADRQLKQLPILPPTTSLSPPPVAAVPVPAPAPSPTALGPTACALDYLVNAGTFNTLIELVEAASQSAELAQTLDSATARVTLLAPTDAGIPAALSALGITTESLLADPSRITQILQYHILPSQIQAADLVNLYSFNTQLVLGTVAQSVAVNGTGLTATFVGKQSSAPGAGTIATACNINIIPINGLLVPSS